MVIIKLLCMAPRSYVSHIKDANAALSAVSTLAKTVSRGGNYLRSRGGRGHVTIGPKGISYGGKMRKSRTTKAKVKRLGKSVRKLQKAVAAERSNYTMRDIVVGRVVTGFGANAWLDVVGSSLSTAEQAMSAWPMYDAATGSVVTAPPTVGTYGREVQMEQYSRMTLRNNYNTPVKVDLYVVVPRADTSIAPNSALQAGLTDQGNVSINSINTQITDSDVFNALWKIKKKRSKILAPGSELHASYSTGLFTYDGSVADSHALVYQRRLKGYAYVIRVEGPPGHDSGISTEFASGHGGCDYQLKRVWKAKYDSGGPKLNYFFENDDQASSMTNGVMTANREGPYAQTWALAFS